MTYTAILAEKPSQAKSYAEAYEVESRDKASITLKPCSTFQNGAIITWAIGHLVELKMPYEYDEKYKKWDLKNMPIIPEKFEYKLNENKRSHFGFVAKILREAKEIYLASDIDREGEAIGRLIINHAGANNKPIKRLWINTMEKEEIREGFKNLRDGKETYNMFVEAQSRQISDWLIGMNLSPLYSLVLQEKGFRGALSIGRVQSPTVSLIYQRQKEIEGFKPSKFYQIEGLFSKNDDKYKGIAKVKENDKNKVEEVLLNHDIQEVNNGIVKSVDKTLKTQKSPNLHSLSSLQSVANRKWKYSPSNVLKYVQNLYEDKLLTYPRTDSHYITDAEHRYLVQNIESMKELLNVQFENQTEPKKRYVNNEKVVEHYAIIPTKTVPSLEKIKTLKTEEKNIYLEVLRTTLAMFHAEYQYEETKIITDVNSLEFHTTGRTEKSKGWKELFPTTQKDKEKEDLPILEERDVVQSKVNIKEGVTKPPKPFSEGQLINLMKTCGKYVEDQEDVEILKDIQGLGTEATRSGIIEAIKKQQYIEVKKNIVHVTDKGKLLCESIKGTLLASPSMTAKWESYLQKIGKGEGSQDQFVNNTIKFIQKMIDEVPEQLQSESVMNNIKDTNIIDGIVSCPSCKEGEIIDKNSFYGCSRYADGCKITYSKKIAGKTITKTNIKTLCTKRETSMLKGFKSKKGKSFKAKLILNDKNKIEFSFK